MSTDDLRMVMLNRLRNRVEAGDGDAILEAISLTAMLALPMPPWLASAVTGAIAAYRNYDVKTLDEAFGVRREKNQRQDAVQSEGDNAIYVIAEVLRLRASGQAMDAQIFEVAGEACGIGKTTAEKWFYKHKKSRSATYLVAMQMAGASES